MQGNSIAGDHSHMQYCGSVKAELMTARVGTTYKEFSLVKPCGWMRELAEVQPNHAGG